MQCANNQMTDQLQLIQAISDRSIHNNAGKHGNYLIAWVVLHLICYSIFHPRTFQCALCQLSHDLPMPAHWQCILPVGSSPA